MGAKATFDPLTRIIALTESPDANGDVVFDVAVDLYSDGKEDWVAEEDLRRLRFPVRSVGGDPKPGGYLGSTFFLASDWKIRPYDADHRLIVVGNLYSEDASDPFLDTLGDYTVRIMQEVSSLPTVLEVETGGGEKDWTDEEHDGILSDLTTIKSKTSNLPADPASQSDVNGLNDLSSGEVRTQVDQSLAAYDPPTRAEVTSDKGEVLSSVAAMRAVVDKVWGVESGEWKIVGTQQHFLSGGVTLVKVNLLDAAGNPTSDLSKVRRRVPV